ncbi:MAG: LytTR family DNA-binding domain-containing protein [Saprospiraceae bacterium]|nr:LytTR family DNA-binding domain-containing protein [Saprospiraceae bacterium]
MSYRALIIDDEKRAINILRLLIERHLPDITQIETALGAEAALSTMRQLSPDVLFLDIEMPVMTGFELLSEIRNDHEEVGVIFTTAYDHYAIKAIRFSAIDYLLKPIDVQELKAAWERFLATRNTPGVVRQDLLTNLLSNLQSIHTRKPRLAVPTQGGAVFFDIDEITHCAADNNYTVFHLETGKRFVASKTLKDYDTLLGDYHFLRVHQSYLVNPAFIKQYTQKGLLELKDGTTIPVSRRKHHWVNHRLKEMYSGDH